MDKPLVSFDYAIKYLLRDKKDYTIVEGFISALLKTIGYSDVKILSQLESESNQEDRKDKRSLADLIVQDTNNQKYIVEIERNLQPLFIHKSCFNTSRLLIDTISQGQDYSQILKIFHISLLYFPPGYIPGTVYHGKTLIQEVKSKEKITFHITDPTTNRIYDASDILPEYFYISVPSFDDKLEEEFDEWLYVMKHDEIPQPHKSSYMDLIAERLNYLKMSEAERKDTYSISKSSTPTATSCRRLPKRVRKKD